MANGYTPRDMIREPISVAAPSDVVVSQDTGLTAGAALSGFRVMFTCSSVSGTVDFRLQQRTLDDWSDLAGANATVAVSADGEFVLKQLALISADQPNFPLSKQLRVVADGSGSATVDKMVILQPL